MLRRSFLGRFLCALGLQMVTGRLTECAWKSPAIATECEPDLPHVYYNANRAMDRLDNLRGYCIYIHPDTYKRMLECLTSNSTNTT